MKKYCLILLLITGCARINKSNFLSEKAEELNGIIGKDFSCFSSIEKDTLVLKLDWSSFCGNDLRNSRLVDPQPLVQKIKDIAIHQGFKTIITDTLSLWMRGPKDFNYFHPPFYGIEVSVDEVQKQATITQFYSKQVNTKDILRTDTTLFW